jgi:hypothetical protein
MLVPLSIRGLHFPNPLNSSVEAAVFGCHRSTVLEDAVIMHVLDKGTEEKGAALERAANFVVEKLKFELLQ